MSAREAEAVVRPDRGEWPSPEGDIRMAGLNGYRVRKLPAIVDTAKEAAPMVAPTGRLNVFLEPNPSRKRDLQERLTAMLPRWFGKADSNAKYALQAEMLDGYVAESGGVPRGLLLLKQSSSMGAEIYWMAVEPACHRSGIGRALVEAAVEAVRTRGVMYLFVATLHPAIPYEPYERTRRFYEAMGFAYVLEEQFPTDPATPSATI
jgi:GNAT superfamily N-acetyltransferase